MKFKKWLKKNYYLLIIFISVIIFLIMLWNVASVGIMKEDKIIYEFISKHFMNDISTNIFKIITNLGSALFIICLTIILVIFIKDKKVKFIIPINLVIITILNLILKNIVQRPRPSKFQIISEKGYSFPSGHSMVSMAFYGLLIYLIYKYIKNKKLKYSLIVTLSILIFLIGISRIYLGVHYASDVIAGFCISLSYLMIYINILKKWVLK